MPSLGRLGGHKERYVRVCFIAHSSADEGANRALIETIDAMKDRGVDCRVFLPRPGAMQEKLSALGVPYSVLNYCWWMGKKDEPRTMRLRRTARNLFTTILALRRIKEWHPHVVFTNTVTVVIGALGASLLGVPHVWHLHEFGNEDHNLRFDLGDRLSYKLLKSLSAICITNSDVVNAKYATHIGPANVRRIYYSMHVAHSNGEPAPANSPVPARKSRFRCVIVGTLSEAKGQTDAIAAFSELQKEGIGAELLIVGRGEANYEHHLRDLVRARSLDNQITFTGQVQDASPFAQSADVVLMCSRAEAFGRVTVEGMLAGKPIIGARSGATPELVQDGITGLLYRLGDPNDLAAKIKYLAQNSTVAEQLGRNAQAWARATFSEERYGRELMQVLKQITATEGVDR
jgi:glycosyltransferase involved in cell wall biosynthesis